MIYSLTGAKIEEIREVLSSIPCINLKDGDKAEITMEDGSKQLYVFEPVWLEKTKGYVVLPDKDGAFKKTRELI